MQKQLSVVLTGGPCGGKSSSIPYLRETLGTQGFLVLTVPEQFTYLSCEGVPMAQILQGPHSSALQSVLSTSHIQQVGNMFKLGEYAARPTIHLLDRGLVDAAPYIPSWSTWTLEGHSPEILSHVLYDKVIHLRSVAYDRPELYSHESNPHRIEDVEGARAVDEQHSGFWKFHPGYVEVDNSTDFQEKLERVAHEIIQQAHQSLGASETEQKFTCACDLQALYHQDVQCIVDRYYNVASSVPIRYREVRTARFPRVPIWMTPDGIDEEFISTLSKETSQVEYFVTRKSTVPRFTRQEREYAIPARQYTLPTASHRTITKLRFRLKGRGALINARVTLDIFAEKGRQPLVEIEWPKGGQRGTNSSLTHQLPSGVVLLEDVTCILAYYGVWS